MRVVITPIAKLIILRVGSAWDSHLIKIAAMAIGAIHRVAHMIILMVRTA